MDQKTFCLGNARDNVLKLLERYSRNGVVMSGGEREDVGKRFLSVLNHHIRRIYTELYRGEKTAAVFLSDAGQTLFPSGDLSDGEQRTSELSGSGVGVVLSVCGCGTVTAENGEEEIGTSFASPPGLFRDVKLYLGDCTDASLTLTAEGKVKLRGAVLFTGICPEEEENAAMLLPDFPEKGVLLASLPGDFLSLCSVRRVNGREDEEYDLFDFTVRGAFLYAKKAKSGEYLLTYKNMPKELCEEDGDFAALPLPHRFFDLLCLVTARDLCTDEQSDVYAKLGMRAAEAEAALEICEAPYRRDKTPYYRDAFRKGSLLRRHFFH